MEHQRLSRRQPGEGRGKRAPPSHEELLLLPCLLLCLEGEMVVCQEGEGARYKVLEICFGMSHIPFLGCPGSTENTLQNRPIQFFGCTWSKRKDQAFHMYEAALSCQGHWSRHSTLDWQKQSRLSSRDLPQYLLPGPCLFV